MEQVTIIDVETTSKDKDQAEVVEVFAASRAFGHAVPGDWKIFYSLVKPVGPVPPETSAVHHLTAKDLEDAPGADEVGVKLCEWLVGTDVIVGHNITSYDLQVLDRCLGDGPEPGGLDACSDGADFGGWALRHVPVLDTLRLAHHVAPEMKTIGAESPSYSLGALRYRLGLDPLESSLHQAVRSSAGMEDRFDVPHCAPFDVLTTERLMDHLVNIPLKLTKDGNKTMLLGSSKTTLMEECKTFAGIASFSQMLYKVVRMPFGKHKGELISDLPYGYRQWCLKNFEQEEDRDLYESIRVV